MNVLDGGIETYKTPLIRLERRVPADKYIRDILQECVVPFVADHPDCIFMYENVPLTGKM